jgi:hypothetical protein
LALVCPHLYLEQNKNTTIVRGDTTQLKKTQELHDGTCKVVKTMAAERCSMDGGEGEKIFLFLPAVVFPSSHPGPQQSAQILR